MPVIAAVAAILLLVVAIAIATRVLPNPTTVVASVLPKALTVVAPVLAETLSVATPILTEILPVTAAILTELLRGHLSLAQVAAILPTLLPKILPSALTVLSKVPTLLNNLWCSRSLLWCLFTALTAPAVKLARLLRRPLLWRDLTWLLRCSLPLFLPRSLAFGSHLLASFTTAAAARAALALLRTNGDGGHDRGPDQRGQNKLLHRFSPLPGLTGIQNIALMPRVG